MLSELADQLADHKRHGSEGGRPATFDREQYKQRNVVERCFNRPKTVRALATRCDKDAVSYRGGLLLEEIVI